MEKAFLPPTKTPKTLKKYRDGYSVAVLCKEIMINDDDVGSNEPENSNYQFFGEKKLQNLFCFFSDRWKRDVKTLCETLGNLGKKVYVTVNSWCG